MTTIDTAIVARYYIECELDNIVQGDNIRINDTAYSADTRRLLEALSFTYRLNSVYDFIESNRYKWHERRIEVGDITLTGMGERLTAIIYGNDVRQDPRRFIDYISAHTDDPIFAELTPRSVPDNRRRILLRQDGEKLKLLDGSHRFLSMMMQGATSVLAYIATPIEPSERPVIGEAVFLRLRRLWDQTTDETFRQVIEATVAGMIRESADGSRIVRAYWVELGPTEEVRAVGQRLINENEGYDIGSREPSDL